MSVCTFFGHRDCYDLDAAVLRSAIEDVVGQGVREFLVGHQGQFDGMVYSCLKSLQARYPDISYRIVLAYLPGEKDPLRDFAHTVYPEGIETVHPKLAVDWRNRYLVRQADFCICYVNHPWGGAYKFASMAKRRGLTVRNLGKLTGDP